MTDDETRVIDEVVADKGDHSNHVLVNLAALDLRTYIAEPDRGRREWTKHSAARDAVYANRRRIRGARGRRLQRHRSEYLERPNAHLYETGGMRRTHLRGHANILKRLLVHVGGFNLGLLMRTVFGVGTPRSLQGQLAVLIGVVVALWGARHDLWSPRDTRFVGARVVGVDERARSHALHESAQRLCIDPRNHGSADAARAAVPDTRDGAFRSRGHVHPVSPSRTVARRGVSMRSLTTGC